MYNSVKPFFSNPTLHISKRHKAMSDHNLAERHPHLHLRPFGKLLVANRGEIAMRIMRGCRDAGIRTVAIFSDADRHSPHVRYADEAVRIGPPPSAESYLVIDRIIAAAHATGAEAIHPGYGFLAERAHFAEACHAAGLVFVGPPPSAIRTMGDKLTARAAVTANGVPLVPGTQPGLDDAALVEAAHAMGFPVLVKAAAGGGGKGMRPVHDSADLPDAIAAARREATAAFGDGTIYIEKMIVGGRHIEFQIIGDGYGQIIHLGERECSLQRRHQKLIEEAPSLFVTPELRAAMGRVACAAAAAVNYVNAGTIEFLVDAERNFYFLEMNTRLQVEHPVTELVTGVDLVREQLRVARGLPLSLSQEAVERRGWSLECRINAEDPYNNFMPATGTLHVVQLPTGPGVRVDTGVEAGNAISAWYDPMISKLITHGESREEATERMLRALDEYRILGVTTNIPFHQAMLRHPDFVAGNFDTKFVEERFTLGEPPQSEAELAAVAAAIMTHVQRPSPALAANGATTVASRWKWGQF
jgi:acetyl-CoA carboxylase biotin carboxylase subunit